MITVAQRAGSKFRLAIVGSDTARDLGSVENLDLGGAAEDRLMANGYATLGLWSAGRPDEFTAPTARIEGYDCPHWCTSMHRHSEGLLPGTALHLVRHERHIGSVPVLADLKGGLEELTLSIARTDMTDHNRFWNGRPKVALHADGLIELQPGAVPLLQALLASAHELLTSIEEVA